ncbi:uncharacterized protein LOC115622959 [Scaptodrosophila lebanonensis]|uniref:Uncharacterized protein LOC115622959 n=1 Tax=Drosophila lebanonensis TaxID=7225 RepID=A0A6J2TC50_DROLE|nr:uncharacterized protein LOC115622959 [Scaptodrosophila lebanonensis]
MMRRIDVAQLQIMHSLSTSDIYMLDLDINCQERIFDYLTSGDCIHTPQTCLHCVKAFQDLSAMNDGKIRIDGSSEYFKSQFLLFCIGCEFIKDLFIDIGDLSHFLKSLSCSERNSFFASLSKKLKSMNNLEQVQFFLFGELHKTWNMELFEESLLSLKELPKLRSVIIDVDGCSVKNILHLKRLEKITFRHKVSLYDLIGCCKANKNLQALHVNKLMILAQTQLTDIIAYCNKLEELHFEAEGTDYADLARLPNLKKLVVSATSCGSLFELFKALGKAQQLQYLPIIGKVSPDDIEEIVGIKSLRHLSCCFSDMQCIEQLSSLTELEVLEINIDKCDIIPPALLNVLKACKLLRVLFIQGPVWVKDFLNSAREVLQEVRNPLEQKPLQVKIVALDWFISELEDNFLVASIQRPACYDNDESPPQGCFNFKFKF